MKRCVQVILVGNFMLIYKKNDFYIMYFCMRQYLYHGKFYPNG